MRELRCISHTGKRKKGFKTEAQARKEVDLRYFEIFHCTDCGKWHASSKYGPDGKKKK